VGWDLGEKAHLRGVRLLVLDEVDSTNEEGKRLIASGERGPLWIVARRQTKGRGRLGREWVSPEGNLHASLVYSGIGEASKAPQLGFVAGVAVIAALAGLGDFRDKIALKWPNDLLLEGAKLGGILLEGVTVPTGDPREPHQMTVVIGIGVNCAFAPGDLPYPARALSSLGGEAPSAQELFASLSDSFMDKLDVWAGGENFAAIREIWLPDAAGLGHGIRINAARGVELRGRFKTIDASGRLVLTTDDGEHIVDAGDVFFGEAGSYRPSNGVA
jgi:BirA family transcriptional regulator, biotin operon repressor / biotin---[acetyl-CoA-carboxylase] ligase